ncbi:MAG: hypothetical protein IT453_21430 [Planctomycetes bacterium]|nr:hypothetical protein [Planctomycetota bacterium]
MPNSASAQGEPGLTEGSSAFEGPIVFSPGWIHFAYASPEIPDFQFDGLAVPLSGYPGSLYFPETAIGPAALFTSADPTGPGYFFYSPSLGIWAPLTYDEPSTAFVGPVGTGTLTVTTTASTQGPGTPKTRLERGADGNAGIFITAPCAPATFKQFFTMTRTWKGTKPNPTTGKPEQTGGSDKGPANPTGNAGHDVVTDGKNVYVDAPAGNGNYPYTTVNADGTTTMEDAPNCNDPNAVAAGIAGRNPGATVNEITTTYHFTTYVYCGGVVMWKIEWMESETNKIPSPVPDVPNGGFSGRSQGPPPAGSPWAGTEPDVTSVNGLDPHHAAALGDFQTGTYGGAAAPSGW